VKKERQERIKNKGTGAGGSKTTLFGKKFEEETSIESNLERMRFKKSVIDPKKKPGKNGFSWTKKMFDATVIYVKQIGLKTYFEMYYGIEIYRRPDEAFIIKTKNPEKCIVKILEKKTQDNVGSVETKIWAGPGLKRDYELMLGDKFVVEYAFCVSKYLSDKFDSGHAKYKNLKQILDENDIPIFYANDPNYYTLLVNWIMKF